MSRQWDSGRVAIADASGLASLLRQVIRSRRLVDPADSDVMRALPRGAQTEILEHVARQIGISRSQLHRLVNGKLDGTSWRTVGKLERWVGEASIVTRLRRCVLGKDTARRRREYVAYLDREIERLRNHRAAKHDFPFIGELRAELEKFSSYAQDRGCPAPRLQLAMLRVVDPVIGWRRLWRSLQPDELLAIVRDGFRRERRLVKREMQVMSDPAG